MNVGFQKLKSSTTLAFGRFVNSASVTSTIKIAFQWILAATGSPHICCTLLTTYVLTPSSIRGIIDYVVVQVAVAVTIAAAGCNGGDGDCKPAS